LHVEEYYCRGLINYRNSKWVEESIDLEYQLKHYLNLASTYMKYGFHGHVKMTLDAARKYLKIEHMDTNVKYIEMNQQHQEKFEFENNVAKKAQVLNYEENRK